jgi:hypothetical protein
MPMSVTLARLQTEPPAAAHLPRGDGFGWFGDTLTSPLPHDPAVLEHGTKTLRLVLEVLAHRRPLRQLEPLLHPKTHRYLTAHLGGAGATRGPSVALIGPTRMSQPHSSGAELSATYRHGKHIGALVARLDLFPDQPIAWQVTALRIG